MGLSHPQENEHCCAARWLGADGFSRLLSNKAKVLIREKAYPIVGKITMDYCMADVGDDPHPRRR